MIDALKRKLGITPAPAQAVVTEKEEVMDVKETGTAAQATAESVASLSASVASLTADLATANSQISEMTSVIAEFVKADAKSAADALAVKLDARKTKIVAAVGTEKADALQAALATMTDGAFDAVMLAMSATVKTEATTALFTEVGVDATADTTKLAAESNPVMDYLTAKYKKA